jgi:hypothetical protein
VGDISIPRAELSHELAALAGNRAFLSRVQSRAQIAGHGPDGLSPQFVASVLSNEINTVAAQHLLATHHAPTMSRALAASVMEATYAQTYGGLTLSSFPAAYRSTLVARTADDVSLEAALEHVNISVPVLSAYRSQHIGQFSRYCVSVVLRPTRRAAVAAARQIRAGAAVSAVAKRLSLDPSAASRGRLGCGTAGQFDTAFAPTLARIPVNTPSDPVHDPQGWYTVVVTARHVRGLVAAAPDLVNALLPDDDAGSEAIASYLRSATVTVDPRLGRFDSEANPPMMEVRHG